ncbi:MAG TPA: cyclic nucleotide-binding domain-containing protein [Acidimicrobiales bacterium]|jgi:CRP-like cAMP-binding protein|nr:cyclic nucleotide-binding domain-containing protein [Acidimicrobiales bacterium]
MSSTTTAAKTAKNQLIGGVGLFTGLNQREVGRVAALVDEIRVEPGQVLCREGRPGSEFFVIAAGRAEATLRADHLAYLGPGAFFGEMSLLDRGPRSATVTATTPMHLLVLDARSFLGLLADHPAVARKVMRGLAERLRASEAAPTH